MEIRIESTAADFPSLKKNPLWLLTLTYLGFPGGTVIKNLPANAGDVEDLGLIPGLERSPGEGNGNPL